MKKILLYVLLGLFVTGSAYAKDLYVATDGSDDTTYEDNDISHPWATPAKAWYNADAGDTVYFRGGTYYVTSPIDTYSQGNDGTAESPITFTNYSAESVTIDFTGISGADNSALQIQRSYNYIDGIDFVADNFDTSDDCIIRLGEGRAASGFKITNCTLVCESASHTDNTCLIRVHPGTDSITIEDNVFVGNGAGHIVGIHMFRTAIVSINRNEISNCDNGIMHKHSNACSDQGFYITNNFIHDCGTGIRTISNYGHYENNLIIDCSMGIKLGDNGGIGDCGVGGDNNYFDHNTFYNNSSGAIIMVYQSNSCDDNEFTNNIFSNEVNLYQYLSDAPTDSWTTSSDYNLFINGDVINQCTTDYTLTEWKSQNSSDTNSLSGSPTFDGGATPSSISDFALTSESIGYQVCVDLSDMGIDVSAMLSVGLPTCTLTGTLTSNVTESTVKNTGGTLILTLTGATWETDIGTDCQHSTDFLAAIDSNKAEAGGWDAQIKAALTYSDVALSVSDTVATVTIGADGDYDITETETITPAYPASVIDGADEAVTSSTFTIGYEATGAASMGASYNASGPAAVYGASGITVN